MIARMMNPTIPSPPPPKPPPPPPDESRRSSTSSLIPPGVQSILPPHCHLVSTQSLDQTERIGPVSRILPYMSTTVVHPQDRALQEALRLATLFATLKLLLHIAANLWEAHIGYGYFRDEMYYI